MQVHISRHKFSLKTGMEKFISNISTLLLFVIATEIVVGGANEIFEAFDEVIREEYYDVFAEAVETSEESTLSCSYKCVQVGEDCTRFHYRAAQKLCIVTNLKRERSGGHNAPLMRYFRRKSVSVQQEKQVSAHG